ncbi:hypothetical protein DASC09_032550 [Saccharomycopsis crataegensis]|uniref:Uncharacterized protein n=1 Tax=Saccharomycopsis crataegensis TaxID=43959 RepID=A0AAV5QNN3_9ASCO|nr:hypothetical protein DASC09_032550 [Saccharomycopsis crataegensis]
MSDSETSDTEYQLPTNLDFEFVDTTKPIKEDEKPEEDQDEPIISNEETNDAPEEFFFPLFATESAPVTSETPSKDDESSRTGLMKVTLNDAVDDEPIIQSRPSTYYFPEYTEQQLLSFKLAAIEYDDIFSNTFDNRYTWRGTQRKVTDLKQYNAKIDEASQKLKKKAQMRPSLKTRKNRILAKKNVKLRKQSIKDLEKKHQKMINQKKKRGGKKNKKKKDGQTATQTKKPEYRTE